MSSPAPARRTPWGGVELLERAIAYTRGSLMLVTEARLTAATPCEGWDLRALLEHMEDSLASLHEAGSARRVQAVPSPGIPHRAAVDLVDSLRGRACQLLAEWSADWESGRDLAGASAAGGRDVVVGGRPLTSSVLTSAGALEVAVHGWDVAVACGVDRPIPHELARDLLRVAPALVTAADRPARFGPELPPRPGDTASDRLLRFLGRDPADCPA